MTDDISPHTLGAQLIKLATHINSDEFSRLRENDRQCAYAQLRAVAELHGILLIRREIDAYKRGDS